MTERPAAFVLGRHRTNLNNFRHCWRRFRLVFHRSNETLLETDRLGHRRRLRHLPDFLAFEHFCSIIEKIRQRSATVQFAITNVRFERVAENLVRRLNSADGKVKRKLPRLLRCPIGSDSCSQPANMFDRLDRIRVRLFCAENVTKFSSRTEENVSPAQLEILRRLKSRQKIFRHENRINTKENSSLRQLHVRFCEVFFRRRRRRRRNSSCTIKETERRNPVCIKKKKKKKITICKRGIGMCACCRFVCGCVYVCVYQVFEVEQKKRKKLITVYGN